MRNQILEDLKTAMKNQDKETLAVIRMVKGAIQMEELNTKKELSDEEVITIITKQIKTRKERLSLADFRRQMLFFYFSYFSLRRTAEAALRLWASPKSA